MLLLMMMLMLLTMFNKQRNTSEAAKLIPVSMMLMQISHKKC